ncbi:acylneuraminate cytidylyltransferase family protein [Neolewinella lacunae]|uniref:Acylneuraminate cytidylyltransferase family protein n=1 Tax=Neolewinella lacunae TaxID=1517758 RepID=A0A923T832_9BACT|nr:acylneuraminate cytidylyltransferase family protein [Neolewinella lacunae]MBC6994149.1 acylneuraminate cytidylyltransferase family protein [Neolewinella lacunae]MDN3636702.1 acylneuraminate cytidylyltransferase family protein [Neolewinella lacunae]
MRVLGIIPARAGSERVPGKNWRPLAGRPLIDYVLAAAAQATSLAEIVVSSDSEEVLALAAAYPGLIALRRPAELSGAAAPAIDYVRHALAERGDFAAVAIVQPTSPFTTAEDIDATVALLRSSGADSAVSVVEIPHDLHPYKFKTLDGDRLVDYLTEEKGRMAAHELPKVYVRNGSVYVARRETIAAGHIIGPDCRAYRMPRERSVDINDPLDWAWAEFLLSRAADR